MGRILFFRIAVVVLFLCAYLPALAQVVDPQKVDPEGVEFRNRLRALVQAEDMAGFKEAVKADGNLSQRAFVAEFLEIWNGRKEGETPELSRLSGLLAEEIFEVHGDAKLYQLFLIYSKGRIDAATYELGRYAEDQFSPYAENQLLDFLNARSLEKGVHYGAGETRRASYSNTGFYIYSPIALTKLRILMAAAYLDPNILISQLQCASDSTHVATMRARELSAEPEAFTVLEEEERAVNEWAGLIGQSQLVAFGLNADFDSENLLKIDALTPDSKLGFLAIRFQAACRASRLEEARQHLKIMEEIVSASSEKRPALSKFVLQTMRFQSRQEDSLTKAQIEIGFDTAWKELDGYVPGVKILDDEDWWAARPAVIFWIDRLASIDENADGQRLNRVRTDVFDWFNRVNNPILFDHYLPGELWLQAVEVGTMVEQQVALLDLYTYWLEKFGMDSVYGRDVAQKKLEGIEAYMGYVENASQTFYLNPEGISIPKLSFEDSSFVRKLKVRNAYLRAKLTGKTSNQLIGSLQAAVPALDTLDQPESYIHYHQLLAKEFEASGRPDLALPLLEKAIDHADKYSFRKNEIELATTLARLYSAQGDWERALLYSNRAQSLLQAALPNSTTREATELGKYSRSAGELSAVAHLKSDDPQAAFEALSQGQQMESAATQLAVNRTVRGDQNDLAAKQQSVEVLERQVKVVESLPPSQTRTELLESNEKRLAATRAEFMTESRKIRAKYPKLYSSTLRLDPLSLPDVQASLPAGTAVVQYFPTAEELYVFVVTGNSFRLHSVAVKQAELDSLVLDYLKKMRMLSSVRGPLGTLSQKLDGLLIEPIAEDVAGSETLLLIPSGSLNVLPFASLADPSGQPLIARKRVVSLAKATDFMKIAASQPRKVGGLVAFANATLDLPSAQHEGETIKGIFPDSKLFVGTEASRDNLLKFAPGADALHLATHGISDSADSLNNYLALAGNGKLTQEEIFNLDLGDTTLVTLSACNTALSDSTEYEFVASIAEAFWIAGSRSVVASLWSVDDDSTEKLMTEFYRGMKEQGLGKAEALQRAQLAVMSQPRFEHPYYWSGFMLFGDYR